jgi:hypothetical protein
VDEAKMKAFQAAEWPEAAVMPPAFEDHCYPQLGRRIVFLERPDLVPEVSRRVACKA